MPIATFTDLVVWQKAHRLALDVYRITKSFPADEKYALTDQMRRSAISIPSNIAEGFGRNSIKDKAHFYSVAKGSLMELNNQVLIAKDLGYIKQSDYNEISINFDDISRLISGLIKSAPARTLS